MNSTEKNCLNRKNTSKSNTSAHDTCKIFSFEGTTDVQVVIINDNPWFVAVDVCNALSLQNTSDRVNDCLDDDEYLLYQIDRAGQKRTLNVVCESGLYALIIRSNKPIARKFRKWITSEVLPAIRKTGMYVTEQAAKKLTGQYIQVIGADDNLYLLSLIKAFRELLIEEVNGHIFHESRFVKKFEAAHTLFPEHKMNLRNHNVKISL